MGRALAGLAILAAAAVAASASWAADARPDFTGVWTWYVEPGQSPFGRGAQTPLPLKPDAKAKVDAYNALVTPTGDNPGGWCLGTGMPGSMLGSGGYPMEIVQRPEQITIIYEAHTEVRRVYLGDRSVPAADRFPDRNGVSDGHWEGDVLVVQTDNLKEVVDQRYVHSDQAKITERYHLAKDPEGKPMLVADMTMTDPGFYTEPVTAQKKWALVPNGHLLPYECAEQGWIEHLEKLQAAAGPSAAK